MGGSDDEHANPLSISFSLLFWVGDPEAFPARKFDPLVLVLGRLGAFNSGKPTAVLVDRAYLLTWTGYRLTEAHVLARRRWSYGSPVGCSVPASVPVEPPAPAAGSGCARRSRT